MFLLIESTILTPEYSSLIICKPARPNINGSKKLINPGKKDAKFTLKKLLKKNISKKKLNNY